MLSTLALAPALLWQYILGGALILLSVVIVILVLMQSGKEKGLSGTIAGSALTMDRAVRNFKEHTHLPLWQVVKMASLNAANSIGMGKYKGSIETGKDADIIITDRNFTVKKSFVGGRCVYGF